MYIYIYIYIYIHTTNANTQAHIPCRLVLLIRMIRFNGIRLEAGRYFFSPPFVFEPRRGTASSCTRQRGGCSSLAATTCCSGWVRG